MKIFYRYALLWGLMLLYTSMYGQPAIGNSTSTIQLPKDSLYNQVNSNSHKQFLCTISFLDASLNSLNSINSLLKKEAYRIKITSFNNPTSSDMGFNLENEIQSALKPLLDKTKNTNTQKFSGVVSTIISSQAKSGLGKTLSFINPVFPTLLSMVGNLTVQEKRISREDLDSFITATSKYFVQYEKLNAANTLLDQNIDRLDARMRDLQYDMKEYMLDMTTIIYKNVERSSIKNKSNEELILQYLDRQKIEELWDAR